MGAASVNIARNCTGNTESANESWTCAAVREIGNLVDGIDMRRQAVLDVESDPDP